MLQDIATNPSGSNKTPKKIVSYGSDQQVTFNGLPAEIIQKISSKLPLPDVLRLKQVCWHTYKSIQGYDINEAKKRYSVEFQNMNKVKIENPTFFTLNMLLFEINNGELSKEKNTVPSIKEVFFNFVLTEFSLPEFGIYNRERDGLNDALSVHIGQLENDMCFILALNPRLSSHFIQFSQKHQMIGYAGDPRPTMLSGENNHSIYCGRSYEDAIKTYELACEGSLLATNIRELLGFQKKYY